MTANKIYHYTSIESLALILKTRKLRFTRLDRVDDIREAQTHLGINFGKFFFVSCWTQQAEESIPQWSMYSREMQGVRIELPEYPFAKKPLRPPSGWSGIRFDDGLLAPISFEDLVGLDYFIVPIFASNEYFTGPINYVSCVEKVYAESIQREVHEEGNAILKISNLFTLPRTKSLDWAFQKEHRFSLFVMPLPPLAPGSARKPDFFEAAIRQISNLFINNIAPSINYIDIPLADDAFDNLVVRMGPLSAPGGRVCVEALLSCYAPSARIELSALSGSIRSPGR